MKYYYVYIIEAVRTSRNNLGKIIYYTGFTDNPNRRFREHKAGIKSKFMSNSKIIPRRIVYLEQISDYFNALKREKQIKQMPLKKKKELIKKYAH